MHQNYDYYGDPVDIGYEEVYNTEEKINPELLTTVESSVKYYLSREQYYLRKELAISQEREAEMDREAQLVMQEKDKREEELNKELEHVKKKEREAQRNQKVYTVITVVLIAASVATILWNWFI